jgi:flagellar basal-body rod modification protein FlgD
MNTIEQVFGPTTNSVVGQPKQELGQEDFLKLMIAQLKNQDPVNPADNSEFLGQIAQFRMVSGIDEMGVSFEGISSNLYAAQAMQASQLVGKDVLTQSETATLTSGEPVEGMLESDEPVTHARMLVHDISGALVTSMDIGTVKAGAQRFAWNGQLADGSQAPDGEYFITAEGLINGELAGIPVSHFSQVESVSVDRNNTNVLLHLANGSSVGVSQVREFK